MITAALLDEVIGTLERVGCQFDPCQGPTATPVPMITCHVCATLGRLYALPRR